MTMKRTAAGCPCKCGHWLSRHMPEPAYYGGERFGAFTSVAERLAGCTEYSFDYEAHSKGFVPNFR